MRINWNVMDYGGYDLNLKRYRRYLKEKGYRESTAEGYLSYIARYLEFVGTNNPTQKNLDEFKESFLQAFIAIFNQRQLLHDNAISQDVRHRDKNPVIKKQWYLPYISMKMK